MPKKVPMRPMRPVRAKKYLPIGQFQYTNHEEASQQIGQRSSFILQTFQNIDKCWLSNLLMGFQWNLNGILMGFQGDFNGF